MRRQIPISPHQLRKSGDAFQIAGGTMSLIAASILKDTYPMLLPVLVGALGFLTSWIVMTAFYAIAEILENSQKMMEYMKRNEPEEMKDE